MHKAVDNCVQAPARNAVKMGGEKMTTRSLWAIRSVLRSDLGRVGKVLDRLCVAMSLRMQSTNQA
ncbi:hypothetical protein ABQ179_007000 [Xanthomonas dyei]|uniref:hypothetical protein n=1 Tax=Xanthomonas dyei TaxID=743699 RepID=UPI0032E850CA